MKNGMIVDEDGNKRWYVNGMLHRVDGPARELANGSKEWYLHGELHREDGPAVENANGYKVWYINGLCHREDGPAYEDAYGGKEWWVNGMRHRIDGPAAEYADGSKEWRIKGKLHRVDGPAREDADGYKEWCINDKLHREDGPAREYADGYKEWRINGKLHREDGPAIERENGDKYWCLNHIEVTEQIVMQPETITLAQIQKSRNNEVRSIMIERYGWARYLADSKAKMIDKRDNVIENTKEALFATRSFGNRLVVTCPTGRVFTLGVPSDIISCEAAQQWLGNSTEEINVIGRT